LTGQKIKIKILIFFWWFTPKVVYIRYFLTIRFEDLQSNIFYSEYTNCLSYAVEVSVYKDKVQQWLCPYTTIFNVRDSSWYIIRTKNSKFWSKIEILFKNRNFVQKSKYRSKIKIFSKNQNFGQKSKFCSKIKILFKNQNFLQKSKFWSKIQLFDKNHRGIWQTNFNSDSINCLKVSERIFYI